LALGGVEFGGELFAKLGGGGGVSGGVQLGEERFDARDGFIDEVGRLGVVMEFVASQSIE